jgi:branched-chain amino acid aminotransferase
MGRRIWRNGLFLPETEAVVSIYDSMCMYSDAIFEMQRSFNKKIFKLDAHLDRLFDSAKFTEMPMPYSKSELRMAHEDLIFANRFEFADDDEYRTYINVSRGPLPIYSEILKVKPWAMISIYPLRWVVNGLSQFYAKGIHAIIPAQHGIPSQFLENKVKNHCRMSSRLAEIEVKRHDEHAWPLLQDDQGFLTEFTGANVFIVKRDRVLTPEPRNCLRGISRNFVLSLARNLGIEYRERNIEGFDAITADECFATATPFCIVPVTSINGRKIGNGKRGKVTSLLMEAWKEAVDCDWEEQVFRWDQKN